MNLCQFVGKAGKDVVVKQAGNTKVAEVSLAVSFKPHNSDKWDGTDWVPVKGFGKIADIMEVMIKKGDTVYVCGEFKTASWEKDGKKQYKTEIIVSRFDGLVVQRKVQQDTSYQQSAFNPDSQASFATQDNGDSSDLPF